MDNIQVTFGQNLRREINRKHLKYAEAADLFVISLSHLNQMMKGTTAPSLDVLYRITEKLQVSADALFYGDSRPVVEKPKELSPSDVMSAGQIANVLNELNNKLTIIGTRPNENSLAGRIALRLATLNESQLDSVDGFIDDLLALDATDRSPSKAR